MHNDWYNNMDSQQTSISSEKMISSPKLQMQTVNTKDSTKLLTDSITANSSETSENSHDWISAFNTSLLTTRANVSKDRSLELGELMQTPEFASLLVGAQHLASNQGLSKEEATERLIEVFRRIDFAWKQIVIKRGLQSIIE